MASILIHTADESVTLTAQTVKRLLDRGDGDAALLYLALLRHHGTVQPRSLAGELRWEKSRIEAAEQALRDLRLLAPAAEEIPEPADEKPSYQRDDIARRLESSEEFRLLTAEVEKKLGKRLTTPDVGVLLGLNDYLGLPADVIFLLVNHCVERVTRKYGEGRRPTLRQIEKEGYAWARRGIDTQRTAVEYLKKYAERQGAIPPYMRALGLGDRLPVASEEKYLNAWQEMGFPPETVALAYDKTVLKCHELKWPYCNGILKRWHEAGLHTPEEIERVVEFVKQSGEAHYSDEVMAKIEESMQEKEKGGKGAAAAAPEAGEDEGDELLPAAVEVVLETGQASVSMLQRRLKLGYSRAARLVDQMEERGIVGPFEGSKPRQLLITRAQWQEMQMGGAPAPEADEPPFPTEEET